MIDGGQGHKVVGPDAPRVFACVMDDDVRRDSHPVHFEVHVSVCGHPALPGANLAVGVRLSVSDPAFTERDDTSTELGHGIARLTCTLLRCTAGSRAVDAAPGPNSLVDLKAS